MTPADDVQRQLGIWGRLTFEGCKAEAKTRRDQSVADTHSRMADEDESRRDARLLAHE